MNFKTSLLALPLVCLLGACQTTGTTTASIPNGLLPSDSQMTCAQMENEFVQLDQIITAAGGVNSNNELASVGAQTVQDLANASGNYQTTGWINSVTNLAGNLTNMNAQGQQQQAQAALNRRTQLLTLAQTKGCM